MKQPKNKIEVLMEDGELCYCSIQCSDRTGDEWALIGIETTKQAALKTAIRRLNRLAIDAQKMLDKL